MDFELFFQQLELPTHLLAFSLGVPRILMIIQVAPFLGGSIVTGQLRITLAVAMYLILHPMLVDSLPPLDEGTFVILRQYGLLMAKEALLGLFIGLLSGMVFWAMQSAGFFMDHQRGSSMAQDMDPLAGEETSPLGSFLFQGMVYLFYAGGAFLLFLGTVYASYEMWPVTALLPRNVFTHTELPLFFAQQVGKLMLDMLLIASPVLVACLLVDVALGLVNRFAGQLNVYLLAMPIKSAVALFLLLLYFNTLLKGMGEDFHSMEQLVRHLRGIL